MSAMNSERVKSAVSHLKARNDAANAQLDRWEKELTRLKEQAVTDYCRKCLVECKNDINGMKMREIELIQANEKLRKQLIALNDDLAKQQRLFHEQQSKKLPTRQKVLVLGASGKLGRKISECLLSHGYNVSLTYFRNKIELSSDIMSKYSENMTEMKCDLDNFTEKQLSHIIKGHSIVISCVIMGGKTHHETKSNMKRIMQKLIDSCQDCGVYKLIYISGAGILKLKKDGNETVADTMQGQFGDFVRAMAEAHSENIEYLKKAYTKSGMEWVVYAPASMKGTENSKATEHDKLIVKVDEFTGGDTKYIDLANIIASNLNNHDYHQHCVSVSFKE